MIFIGDVHGKFDMLEVNLRNFRASTFIQVGDFGLGFGQDDSKILENLNRALKLNNNKMYIIRGNHDNPEVFKSLQDVNPYNHLIFPKECSVHTIEGRDVFFCGGATSIDKNRRTKNLDWWENESLDISNLGNVGKFDICVTHTCHHEIPLNMTFMLSDDIKKYVDDFEQKQIREIKRIVEMNGCKDWVFGHFHQYLNCYHRNVRYVCVPELNFFEIV